MNRPSVSVVIPAYNSQDTIRAALESVFAQSIPPDEVIVVDDASSDNTCAVVTSNFPSVRLLQKPNGGPSSARNLGIENAKFEWIAFLDADDIWAPEKSELQLSYVSENPKAVVIASNWSSSAHSLIDTGSRISRPKSRNLWTSDILVLNRFQTSTVLARRAQLRDLEGFSPALDGAEDWDMWLRLSRLGEVILVEEPLVFYRDTSGGYSKDLMRLMLAMEKMMQRESESGGINPRLLNKIWGWHYLRFMVGFLLERDSQGALVCIRRAIGAGLARQLPVSAWDYLVPFLGSRLRRRFTH